MDRYHEAINASRVTEDDAFVAQEIVRIKALSLPLFYWFLGCYMVCICSFFD